MDMLPPISVFLPEKSGPEHGVALDDRVYGVPDGMDRDMSREADRKTLVKTGFASIACV